MPSTDVPAPPVKPFKFAQGQPRQRVDDNKENLSNPNAQAIDLQTIPSESPQKSQRLSQASPNKRPPSTPATRLPLADLLGENEDAGAYRRRSDISPQEQLGWKATRSPRSSNSKATPGARGHKRAHSSTPPSASQRSAMKKAKQKAVLDLEELKQSLRTPQTDPATDLWNKYNLGVTRDTPVARQLANLTSGLTPSSPYAHDEQTGNVSGLRRWTSCGLGFPNSKRKRRKIETGTGVEDVAAAFDGPSGEVESPPKDRTKALRIGTLLEKISEDLERSKQTPDQDDQAPSSSSPLPERHEEFNRQSISPLRAPALARGNASGVDIVQRAAQEGVPVTEAPSDYGSDPLSSPSAQEQQANEISLQPHESTDAEAIMIDEGDFDDDYDISDDDFDDVLAAAAAPLVEQDPWIQDERKGPDQDFRDVGNGDDDEDDVDEELFAAAEATATQSHSISNCNAKFFKVKRRHRAIQRYLIKDVFESEHISDSGRKQMQKVLSVQDEKTSALKAITLRDSWYDTRCSTGSYVHVIGYFDKRGHCVINDDENMLILHPDHLISALAVADSFSCMRKAVLQDRVKAASESTPPIVYGTVLHEIFQEAMMTNRWDEDWLNQTIGTTLDRHMEDLYQTHLTFDSARIHLQNKIPELQSWAQVFIKSKNEGFGTVKDRNGRLVQMSVHKLLDVEEHIWSPMYGLKGNIDATIQITMDAEDGRDAQTLTVPFELKTGKRESPSHRAQTALYTLLLSDRYDVAVAYGILYYVETSQTLRIPAIRHELRHMIMQRNELACYVRERLALPPMLRNTHMCSKCYAKEPCFIYHKLVEDGDGETSGLRNKFEELTKQLGPTHQAFFRQWNDLLTKEESEMMKFRRELWTMLSREREKLGRCFANVSLITESAAEEKGTSRINRYTYSFHKLDEFDSFSFNESQIATGDPIVVSDELGHYALAKGYVTSLTKTRVEVAVDRRLHNARTRLDGFHAENNQVFAGITDTFSRGSSQWQRSQSSNATSTPNTPVLYRVDKDEFSNGMSLVRANLVSLMSQTAFNANKLRSLIVDKVAPAFRTHSTAYDISGPASQTSINTDQRRAIEKILSAEDYALVLGMPGTGKTTTIAHIIRALVAKGKSVLLTSYTHSAVDNILLKLRDDQIPMLRLGTLSKIHPDVGSFASLAAEPRATIEELERLYHDPQVVATTCLGINHGIFQQRTFDYCIVDEASQITLPVCLGPIRLARSFVLVGDHFQLPPLVQNKAALEGGLDISLFRTLCEVHPEAVVELGVQYRMNAEIMSVANSLIYNGRLECGNEAVATRRLDLPRWRGDTSADSSRGQANVETSWIARCLAPNSSPLVFLNTDALPPYNHEHATNARITNRLEAHLATALISALITSGVPAASIGVITFYRSQLSLLKTHLSSLGPGAKEVEAHTADRFQGRDKEVVILSYVRSNEARVVGELLKDWRRVNVAVTRARSKILCVGSRRTLSGDPLLQRLVACFEDDGGVVDLGEGWEGSVPALSNLDAASPQRSAIGVANNTDGKAPEKSIETNESETKRKPKSPRKPLAPLREKHTNTQSRRHVSIGQKPFKVPAKVAKGGLAAKKGPVLDDVMREILGTTEEES
ncbi:MAG: hypothetical protein Q9162_004725 [Coniocarpon cinnabarinum]